MLRVYPWQEGQWRQIQAAIQQNKIPHALLLTGQEGVGLGNFANQLAMRLLCASPTTEGYACNQCNYCTLFIAGTHPDIVSIEPEEKGKQIKIDMIREVIGFIQLTSQYGQHKIVVINPAEAMNRNAFNSLLKTLEEPPPDSIIILVSHKASLLPVTIRSRCQRINFNAMADDATLSWIASNIEGDGVKPRALLEMAHGGPLKALQIHESGVESMQMALVTDLMDLRGRGADPVQTAQKWHGLGAPEVLQWLTQFFGKMSRMKLAPEPAENIKSSVVGYLQELSNELDLQQLVACYDLTLKNYHAITGPFNLNKQGLLEDVIIFWQTISDEHRGRP